MALKLKGKSYRAIADELKVSVSVAFEDVWHHFAELDKAATEDLEKIRKVELARMDAMLVRLFEIVERPGDEADGDAVKAIVAAAKLMERRAKLLGLDAPTKIQEVPSDEVAKMTPAEKVDAHRKAIEELEKQLAEGKDGMH